MERLKQREKILDYLQNHNGITSLEAMIYLKIVDVRGVIKLLRRSPEYVVTDRWERNAETGSRYKRFFVERRAE